ncbi:putative transcription coactivator-like protein [Leptotrombidium deliense]|uniref:Protein HTATIP2 n=1 Tax=Leptotrombidium deliense TaxID=299467 RepID=A0A443SB02_9ACAR|nr:putative transcription coactivator-like protein [Leptotrombidium deliense]
MAHECTLSLSALVIGATGAIGECLVVELLKNDNIAKVTTIARRKIESWESICEGKLTQIVVDFNEMDTIKDEMKEADVAFSCLGMKRFDAKSAELYKKLEVDANVQFAQMAKEAGVENFTYISGGKADSQSWFLAVKVKGETEEALKRLCFKQLNIYRPMLLDRKEKSTCIEKMSKKLISSIAVDSLAKVMLHITLLQMTGNKPMENHVRIIENAELAYLIDNM